MVTEVNSDDIAITNSRQVLDSGKIQPVKEANPVQDLPSDGKRLPQESAPAEQIKETLDQVAKGLNDHAQFVNRELQFSIDQDSGQTVIKVMDSETQEVIRQIPGEEALQFARTLNEGGDVELFDAYI